MNEQVKKLYRPNAAEDIPVIKNDGTVNVSGIIGQGSVTPTRSTGLESGLLKRAVEHQQQLALQKMNTKRNQRATVSVPGSGISGAVIEMNNEQTFGRQNQDKDNTRGEILANMLG